MHLLSKYSQLPPKGLEVIHQLMFIIHQEDPIIRGIKSILFEYIVCNPDVLIDHDIRSTIDSMFDQKEAFKQLKKALEEIWRRAVLIQDNQCDAKSNMMKTMKLVKKRINSRLIL